jgi:hypothetical protein
LWKFSNVLTAFLSGFIVVFFEEKLNLYFKVKSAAVVAYLFITMDRRHKDLVVNKND